MPGIAADEVRALPDRELAEAINEAYRELFNLRFQKGTRQLQDVTTIQRARRQVARLRTIQRERQLAVAAGAPIEPLTEAPSRAVSPQKRKTQEARRAQEETEAAAAKAAEATGESAAGESAAAEPAAAEPAAAEPAAAEPAAAELPSEENGETEEKGAPADAS